MKTMEKLPGSTLVEVLMALLVVAVVVPASLGALGTVLMAELKVHETTHLISAAEWWLNNLTHPVNEADINAAPRVDRYGKARFDWETENLHCGAIHVTLRVHGRLPGSLLTTSRIY